MEFKQCMIATKFTPDAMRCYLHYTTTSCASVPRCIKYQLVFPKICQNYQILWGVNIIILRCVDTIWMLCFIQSSIMYKQARIHVSNKVQRCKYGYFTTVMQMVVDLLETFVCGQRERATSGLQISNLILFELRFYR